MRLLIDDIFAIAPLKCGTRSIRLYTALAKNKIICDKYEKEKLIKGFSVKDFLEDTSLGFKIKDYVNRYKRDGYGIQHSDYNRVKNYNEKYNTLLTPEDFIDYELGLIKPKIRIAFVRDPVKRFLSAYNMICKNFLGDYPIQKFINNFGQLMWEHTYYREHFKYQTGELGLNPQWYTLILDINDMIEFKKILENDCKYPLPIVHINKTSHGLKYEELTSEQINWIKEKYAIDYNLYGEWFK